MTSSVDLYPDLVAECGPAALRVVPFRDLGTLADLVAGGLVRDGRVTLAEWYEPEDLVASARRAVAYHLSMLAERDPRSVVLPLGIYVDGELVGVQSLHLSDFAITREVSTGSWVAPERRGHGIGTAARAAVLAVGFELVGADWAVTEALDSNVASIRVTEANGYRPDGTRVAVHHGERAVMRRFRLARADWSAAGPPEVRLGGFGPWLERHGLGPA